MRIHQQILSTVRLCIILSSLFGHSLSFTAAGRPARRPMSAFNDDLASTTSLDSLREEVLDHILEVAIEASTKAGAIILGNAGGAEITERKANSRDLLTLIDPLCEKVC
jgi:hypothetical protein